MDGYLVLARCAIDDVPLRLFPDFEAAEAYAKRLTPEDVMAIARNKLGLDTSIITLVSIVWFVSGEVFDIANVSNPAFSAN